MHSLTIGRTMPLPSPTLYRAWTTGWDTWFAEGDTLRVRAEVGAPYFFEVAQHFDDGRAPLRHPHYGRFLALEPPSLVSLTWVTGAGGTAGAETVLTVRLEDVGGGTAVTVTHAGFATTDARDAHASSWPQVLAQLEARLLALGDEAGGDHPESRSGSRSGTARAVPARGQVALPHNRSIPDAALIPVRSYPDIEAAATWLREVLGCRERLRIPGQRIQLTVGSGAVVVAAWDPGSAPATGGRPPAILMVRVVDVDAAYARAVALGATGLTPPADQPYGEREASVRDPAGHAWSLTQTIADVDPATWGGEWVEG